MPFTDDQKKEQEQRFLCVSIHDVAPHTWQRCAHLLRAVRQVADIPVSLLVVPAYHYLPLPDCTSYEHHLNQCLSHGYELVLHGFTHVDEGRAPGSWWERYKRQVFTLNEGEFSALDAASASDRLAWGRAWFQARQWPLHGFVAPAWLLSAGSWQALAQSDFMYTTTLWRFYCLPQRRSVFSPSLVYSTRNGWGRVLSRGGNDVGAMMLRNAPLLRLGLHPRDADFDHTITHIQKTIERLLLARTAVTKADFARYWLAGPGRMQSAAMVGGS